MSVVIQWFLVQEDESAAAMVSDYEAVVAQPGGHYEVAAISLVDDCEHEYNPLGLLVWLPVEACFGSWDPDHWDLLTFPGATWADIVANPARYLDAIDDPSSKDPYLVPVGHPYVMPEPTDERDAD